jgi:hypothetical protein
MKKIYSVLLVVWFLAASLGSYSQINQGGTPLSFQNPQLLNSAIVFETMPAIDIARLQAEDAINDQNKDIPWRFGENIAVNFNPGNSGTWEILPTGDKVWRLGIKSPGAFTINLTFDKYHLPPGATLFVYNEDKSQVIGAFTEVNNQEDNVFATTLVKGDVMVIEYFEPSAPEFTGELNLTRVTHGYRDAYNYAKSFGSSGSCNYNVVCPLATGWENEVKTVCMLVTGGSGFCTGVLVNNTSNNGVPYVLTANHCYSDPSSWVFWYNWQSATCANPPTSPPYNSLSGATLKARYTDSDFCLVQMNTTPPTSYNVYYAGWNRQDVAATSGACIHHPSGDIKKFSNSIVPFTSDTWTGTPANSHWKVMWNLGVTEPGSSGSPIFDQNHRVVGQLHGGPSACGASQLWDFYGKFSMSWNQGTTPATRLKDWLDPTNTQDTILNGFDPALPVPIVVTLPATSVTPTTATLNANVNPNGHATTCYFEWGTSVAYGNNTTTQSIGSGTSNVAVNAGISGLTLGITYHFRIVANNSFGTSYGSDMSFTPGAAAVTTTAATAITATTATSGGNVTTDGGYPVTARGVCWGTTANPAISGNHTTDGSGLGVFTSSLTGLSANTTYHIRAYATNGSGTYYGADLQFVTSCGYITGLPFNEGFEGGATRPNCWSEENSNPAWQFITGNGNTHPSNAHTGTLNACLKDNTSTSNKNKLITPIFDMTGYTNVQLKFWHTQEYWAGDQDELRVFYRTTSTGTWILLQTYTQNIAAWTEETIPLTTTSAEFQVAFEGDAKYGYGVCIDDILITGTSTTNLTVTPSNQNVGIPAGSTNFTVTCTTTWTAVCDATSWCTVTPSGNGNGTIIANYLENTTTSQRIAHITVSAPASTSQVVTVTQAGITPTLAVSPSNQNVTPPAGTTTFSVTSNTNWTVTSDMTWCVPTSSGTGNGTINAVYTQNTTVNTRIATLTVTVIGLSPMTVTVTQGGVPPLLSVSPSNYNVSSATGSVNFTVTSNTDWTVTCDATWCNATVYGSGNGLLTAVYEENTSVIQRVANITVTIVGLAPVQVTVTQAGATPTLAVQPPNQDVTSDAGNTDFTVSSNTNWTAVSDATWCTVTASGSGNGSIVANYSANSSTDGRMATVTVTVTGLTPIPVTVTQAPAPVSIGENGADGVRIYPNPSTGLFKVVNESAQNTILEIIIMDYTGRVIASKSGTGEKEFEFDLSSAAQGAYMMKIKTEKSNLIHKLVISK